MDVNWNKKYTTIAIYSALVVIVALLGNYILSEIDTLTNKMEQITIIFQPFIIGFVIAYLLNFILNFYEQRVFAFNWTKRLKENSTRKIAILCSYLTAGFFIYIFIYFIVPQLVESLSGLVDAVPRYVKDFTVLIEDILYKLDIKESQLVLINEKISEFMNWFIHSLTNMIPAVGEAIFSFASSLWNIVLGLIISVYFLADKERFLSLNKKLVTAFLSERKSSLLIDLTQRINLMFNRFIGGQLLDSAIIGILLFIVLSIFKIPYALLISVLIGCTNIVPFFGPFIGIIPSAIIVLFASPTQFIWFILIVLVVQQIDANLIGPKILGDSVGVSPFWILFSILVFGNLFGFIGMVMAVPLFAVFYSIVKETAEKKLAEKGLPIETIEYNKK